MGGGGASHQAYMKNTATSGASRLTRRTPLLCNSFFGSSSLRDGARIWVLAIRLPFCGALSQRRLANLEDLTVLVSLSP